MCTEKNPLACHRFSLVARGIIEQTGIDVSHVLTDASIVSTELLENQMLKDFNLEQDFFSNRNERIDNNKHIIDSIKTINKEYKNKLNKLDSIKDAEIIEVKKLDNDSTVKLFYRLIRE